MSEIYLDHAATTPVREEVLEAMWPFFSGVYANPSSVHGAGAIAADALARAREMIADVLNCSPTEVVFTGSGTEADNLAVVGVARALRGKGRHVIMSSVEHDAVLQAAGQLEREGFVVTRLPVDAYGIVDPADVSAALREDTVLVSVMLANNEIGSIQPVAEIGRLVRNRGAVMHTDAVQAAGALPLDVDQLGVDLLTLSAHKMYGPKGVGLLYVRRGTPIEALVHGGGQERGRRAGTENVPGAVGIAVALALAEQERKTEAGRLTAMRDRLIAGALHRLPRAHLTGHPTDRLPNHVSLYFDDVSGESVLVNLDRDGIACSSGSACHAGSTEPSHVLLALGLSAQQARNGIRLTLGKGTTEEDVTHVLDALPSAVAAVQGRVPAEEAPIATSS